MISAKLRDAILDRHAPGARARLAKGVQLHESFSAVRDPRKFFDPGLVLNTNVVFVDICGSARRTASMEPQVVKEYLDEYYDAVVPEIYDRDGEIDKLIGDGIIAVFGPPFTGTDASAVVAGLASAVEFGRSVVQKLAYTPLEVKCAIRQGILCFTVVGDEHYHEPTIVGSTLTELHALESVCVDRALNMFASTPEHALTDGGGPLRLAAASHASWRKRIRDIDLKGSRFTQTYVEEWVASPVAGSRRW
jgi:class 3 adenylate cyclase